MSKLPYRVGEFLSVLWLMSLFPGASQAAETTSTERIFRGQVVTAQDPLAPSGDENSWNRYLKSHRRSHFKRQDDGTWKIHFIAFLNQAIGAKACNVVVSELRTDLKPRFVHNFIHELDPKQRSLVSQVSLSPEQFKAGRYRIQVTRVIQKKVRVYASADFSLK